jgi:signal transduction histidine kinase
MPGSGERVLVVDDDDDTLDMVNYVLTLAGFEVVRADSVKEALEKYAEKRPDVVVSDIGMPEYNGYALVSLIKERDATLPVIALTAYTSPADSKIALASGFVDHIGKPFGPKELIESVKFYANANHSETEIHRLNKLLEVLQERYSAVEARLEKATRATADDSEALKAICAIAAHRMKGELLHIGSAVEDIRAEFLVHVDTETHHELSEHLSVIDRGARYIDSAIRQLLAYVDVGPAGIKDVGLAELLNEFNDVIQPRVPRNVRFKIAPLPQQLPVLNTDRDQLLAVLLEIVTNALKAVRETSGEVCLSITTEKDEVLMTISDNGPGIPSTIEKDLFRMPTGDTAKGLGVGLLLCKRIMKYLNGTLKVETGPNGTTVTVVLPLKQETLAKETAERTETL